MNGRRRSINTSVPVLEWQPTGESDHFVQFYEDDAFLVASVSRYLHEGFITDTSAILIATQAHVNAISGRLRDAGIDVPALQAAGRFVTLDAAGTLELFMVDGMPDVKRFNQHLGALVERATHGGRVVRVFGEMVALLWAGGNPNAALRLEELWNELGRVHAFSLFCAYPMSGFAHHSCGTPFVHICQAHRRTLPAESHHSSPEAGADELRDIAIMQQKAAALQAEIQIAEAKSRHLAAIVESSDDAIISKTLQGIITSWNQSAERMFGYTAEEAVGRSILMLIPPERRHEEPEILSRVSRGEHIAHYETVRVCKAGGRLEISLSVSPIKDAEGRIIGVSKIARDITERRQAEAALKAAQADLEKANAELEHRVQERTAALAEVVAQMEEFSYTVSHDIRAPLRGMQVYSQALLEDYGGTLGHEARHCLERIAENATRLDKMVLDVLTFSRVSRAEIRLERISLDKLVRAIVQNYSEMQPPRAEVTVERLLDVIGHEPSVMQAISNLMTNAVKFVAPGVTPQVRIWTERKQGAVRLWVQDNGIGISPNVQKRLFRMFERGHPGLSYDGTGVGLAIVRKALSRMGGETGVESDGTSGSRFWIQLPTAGDPA